MLYLPINLWPFFKLGVVGVLGISFTATKGQCLIKHCNLFMMVIWPLSTRCLIPNFNVCFVAWKTWIIFIWYKQGSRNFPAVLNYRCSSTSSWAVCLQRGLSPHPPETKQQENNWRGNFARVGCQLQSWGDLEGCHEGQRDWSGWTITWSRVGWSERG